jgi:hypothetical protein
MFFGNAFLLMFLKRSCNTITFSVCLVVKKGAVILGSHRGDQIGLIFAHWVIVCFVQFFKSYPSYYVHIFWGLLFPWLRSRINMDIKWAGLLIGRFFRKLVWDRCYDFKNIFDEKFSENFGIFLLKLLLVFAKNCDRNIGF